MFQMKNMPMGEKKKKKKNRKEMKNGQFCGGVAEVTFIDGYKIK